MNPQWTTAAPSWLSDAIEQAKAKVDEYRLLRLAELDELWQVLKQKRGCRRG